MWKQPLILDTEQKFVVIVVGDNFLIRSNKL